MMTTPDLTSYYATITAVTTLTNPHNLPGSKKKIILDAEIFVGGEKCKTLLSALSFFNKSNMNFKHSGIMAGQLVGITHQHWAPWPYKETMVGGACWWADG